jgi:hypothetical protein
MDYYSGLRRNEIMMYVTSSVHPEDIMLNEISIKLE